MLRQSIAARRLTLDTMSVNIGRPRGDGPTKLPRLDSHWQPRRIYPRASTPSRLMAAHTLSLSVRRPWWILRGLGAGRSFLFFAVDPNAASPTPHRGPLQISDHLGLDELRRTGSFHQPSLSELGRRLQAGPRVIDATDLDGRLCARGWVTLPPGQAVAICSGNGTGALAWQQTKPVCATISPGPTPEAPDCAGRCRSGQLPSARRQERCLRSIALRDAMAMRSPIAMRKAPWAKAITAVCFVRQVSRGSNASNSTTPPTRTVH
jgi:hypothetical protein